MCQRDRQRRKKEGADEEKGAAYGARAGDSNQKREIALESVKRERREEGWKGGEKKGYSSLLSISRGKQRWASLLRKFSEGKWVSRLPYKEERVWGRGGDVGVYIVKAIIKREKRHCRIAASLGGKSLH